MTDTDLPGDQPTEPLPPEPASPRRLHRSRDDRVLGGVAGGLGRHFDVDPVVFRITLSALAFVGGVGIFIYLAALLFVPAEGDPAPPLDRSRVLSLLGLGLLACTALAITGDDAVFGPLIPLAFLAGVGYAAYRLIRRRPDDRPVTFGRIVAWMAIGIGALLATGALAAGSAYAAAEGSGAVVAGVVIAIGALLVGSAVLGGGARWLVLPALAVAGPLGLVAAADVRFEGGFGDREYQVATVSELPRDGYKIAAGELDIDLRDVDFPTGSQTVLPIQIGMGYARVLVPEDVCVSTDSRVGGGYMNIRGRDAGGLDMDYLVRATSATAPTLLVRADVGFGAVEVVANNLEDDGDHDAFGDDFDRGFGRGLAGPPGNGGCDRIEIASAG